MMTHAILLALALAAAAEASIDRGKELFANRDLGANGRTCVQCHVNGKDLDADQLAAYSPKDVGILSNHCLSVRMKSEKLAPGSAELDSLVMYVRTFRSRRR